MSGVGDPNSAVGAALSQRVVWPGVPNKRINLARPSAASKRRVTLAAEPAQVMRGALAALQGERAIQNRLYTEH